MSDYVHTLKGIHTTLIDSRDGYKEARSDTASDDLKALFQGMIAPYRPSCAR